MSRRLALISIILIALPLFAQIEIKVNWTRPGREISPALCGVNVWGGFDAKVAENAKYQSTLDDMNLGLIRLHSAESSNDSKEHPRGWVIKKEKRWDSDKINAILTAFGDKRSRIMINIANWPSWIDANGNGRLDATEFDAHADWCAQLVRIVNLEQGHAIRWWTPFNEAEGKVEGKAAGLAQLFIKCAAAMKAVDPTVLVGGGEWSQPWDDAGIDAFIAGAGSTMDFFTYHHYISGDANIADIDVYNGASGIAGRGSALRGKLKSAGLNIPLWLTEYNIFWSWEFDQQRGLQRGIKGAIFNALLFKGLAEAGQVDAALLWNDCDHTYGVMGSDYRKRPNTHWFALQNAYLSGKTVNSSSKASALVSVLAVDAPTGKAVLLINKSEAAQAVNLVFTGWTPSSYQTHVITAAGYDVNTAPLAPWDAVSLPPLSLTLIHYPTETSVAKASQLIRNHVLHPAFPNPFNPSTTIVFELATSGPAVLEVFDLNGRLIATLADGHLDAGRHVFFWNATDRPSGVYFCRLTTPAVQISQRMALLK